MSHEIITEKSFERVADAPKAAPRIVKFTNFSNEDFTYTWNKVPYTFPAGEFRFMETSIANHFAKHLVNRELLKLGRENDTSPKEKNGVVWGENVYFKDLYERAIQGVDTNVANDQTALEQEVIDRDMRAKLGLPQATAPIAQNAPQTNVPAQKVVDPTAPATESEFDVLDGDLDEEEAPAVPSNMAATVAKQG